MEKDIRWCAVVVGCRVRVGQWASGAGLRQQGPGVWERVREGGCDRVGRPRETPGGWRGRRAVAGLGSTGGVRSSQGGLGRGSGLGGAGSRCAVGLPPAANFTLPPMSTGLTVLISAAAIITASLLGAIVGSWLSGRVARELDELARHRDQELTRAEIRAAAAFIRADLDASRRRLREAMEDDESPIASLAWRTSSAPSRRCRFADSGSSPKERPGRFASMTRCATRSRRSPASPASRSGCWSHWLPTPCNRLRPNLARGAFGRPLLYLSLKNPW
jgi:hypothetical protein